MLAIGIEKLEYAAVGDGVPGTPLTELTDPIAEGTILFNFSEPTETRINSEQSDDPIDTILTKDDLDYIEFDLISPTAATLGLFAGGTVTVDKWAAPTTIPEIFQTIKLTSRPKNSKQVEYTIVNGKINCRLSQSPGKRQSELWKVRVYVQAAVTSGGVVNTPYIREIVTA